MDLEEVLPIAICIILAAILGFTGGHMVGHKEAEEQEEMLNRVWNIGFQEGVVCGGDYRPSNVTVEECITIVRYNGNYVETWK